MASDVDLYNFFHVTCPDCTACARFDSAQFVGIKTRDDQDLFKKLKGFEVCVYADGCGHKRHCVLVYGALDGIEDDLPTGYTVEDFQPISRYYLGGEDLRWRGRIICDSCGLWRKHTLDWPKDAYFTIEYKGETLWAYNRKWGAMLRDFIAEGDSNAPMFRKIPAHFRNAKARDEVLKRLDKALFGDA